MEELPAFVDRQLGIDHYTRPYDHIIRIETALSNTTARLYECAEKNLTATGKPRDKVTEQLVQTVGAINKILDQAVQTWEKTQFRDLGIIERLTRSSDLVEAGRKALVQAETDIKKVSSPHGAEYGPALKIIAAQRARLDGVLEEHRERERAEGVHAFANTRLSSETPADTQTTVSISAFAARAIPAQIESGTYRGSIVAVTESAVLQQISPNMTVLHQKRLLDKTPDVPQSACIRYSNGTAVVKALDQPMREKGLGR